uniref:poly [ADP-ribose] polymerase 15-like n=1 Tax=Ciona intestinalis TaxID=7719 RepID=UPI00089DBDC1
MPTTSPPPSTSQAPYQSAAPHITIVEKNITDQSADIIVNITTAYAVNIVDGSAVSRSIHEAAGKQLQKECNNIPEALKCTWGVVGTNGYDLPCKKICHAMIAEWDFNDEITSRSHVKEVVAKCLEMANTYGHTSIAFPLVGCGSFNIPPYVLVESIQEEVNAKSINTSLQHVYVVVPPSEPYLTQMFKDKLQTNAASTSVNFSIDVYCGNIEQQHVGVIVNSVGATMDLMNSGLLSQCIVQQGGDVILQQFNDMKRKYASSAIRVTDGGNLPCDVVIHGATSKLGIVSLVTKSLFIAEALGKSTVAIPALGTGAMGKPPSECAKLIKQGITLFERQTPFYVKNVKVVVFQKDMVSEFKVNLHSTTALSTSGIIALGPIVIRVFNGDITEQMSEVYVNSVSKNMDLFESGPLAKAITEGAGDSILAQFYDSHRKFATDWRRVTEGGNLKCDIIIHVSPRKAGITKCVKNALKIAEKFQKSSVTLPALGT